MASEMSGECCSGMAGTQEQEREELAGKKMMIGRRHFIVVGLVYPLLGDLVEWRGLGPWKKRPSKAVLELE